MPLLTIPDWSFPVVRFFENIGHFCSSQISGAWGDYADFVTRGHGGGDRAISISGLFAVMISSFILFCVFVWRNPLTVLDKALTVREFLFASLLASQFALFYGGFNSTLLRASIYIALFVTCITMILTLVRENRMTAEEVEEERHEALERRKSNGGTRKG